MDTHFQAFYHYLDVNINSSNILLGVFVLLSMIEGHETLSYLYHKDFTTFEVYTPLQLWPKHNISINIVSYHSNRSKYTWYPVAVAVFVFNEYCFNIVQYSDSTLSLSIQHFFPSMSQPLKITPNTHQPRWPAALNRAASLPLVDSLTTCPGLESRA